MTPKVVLYDCLGSICCQMVRVTLAEKGVAYDKRPIDISDRREQFEPWYTALNPKAVVPTLQIDDEVICDTKVICPAIDARFEGPALSPSDPAGRARMTKWMNDVMAPHYGVLLYSRKLDENRHSSIIAGRGELLRELQRQRPEAVELLQRRIDGNARMQRILADPVETQTHFDGITDLLDSLEGALGRGDYVMGDQWTMADAFWTAALARFDQHRLVDYTDGSRPGVAAYYQRLQNRPSWSEALVQNGR